MKSFLSLTLVLSTMTLGSFSAWANPQIQSQSHTRKVVAYNNQAMVTRTLSLTALQIGSHEIVVQDLPVDLIADSLSVSGQGSAKALIHHVEVRPLEKQSEHPELQRLKAQLETIAKQKREIQDQQALNQEHRQFLSTVRSISDEKIRKQLAYYQIKIKDWEDLNRFLLQHHQEILSSERILAQKTAKLDKQRIETEAEIRKWQAQHQQKKQSGVIYLSVESPGNLELHLTYLVPGVSWSSAYEARLDTEKQRLRLSYFGDIRQQTQENWSQVELALSTSNALAYLNMPVIQPWQLTYNFDRQNSKAAPAAPRDRRAEMAQAPIGRAVAQERNINFAQSEVVDKGVSVVYKIPQPVSIESADQARRVAIATRYFEYEPEYDVYPKFSKEAFLKIRFKNVSGMPYLAGPVRTYINDDFTGKSGLPLLLQNEQGQISFGVDSNLKVAHKQTKNEESLEGVLRETRRKKIAYQMEVSNFTKEKQTVNVYDQIPIAADDRIKIKVVETTPKPSKIEDNGVVKWQLSLAPWEKKTLVLEFWVDSPANLPELL